MLRTLFFMKFPGRNAISINLKTKAILCLSTLPNIMLNKIHLLFTKVSHE